MNDIIGADVKCPICSGSMQVELVGRHYCLFCPCGHGKEEYTKEKIAEAMNNDVVESIINGNKPKGIFSLYKRK